MESAHASDLKSCVSTLYRAFSFLTISSVFAGLTIACLLAVSFFLQGFYSIQAVLACFFLAVAVYNVNKLTDLEEDSVNVPERARFVKRYYHYIIASVVVSFCAAIVCAFSCNPYSICAVVLGFCIGALYSVRLFGVRLKEIVLVKNVTIAGTCVVGAVLVPFALHLSSLIAISLIAYFVFFTVFINTVLFDVRDLEGDQRSGTTTIPVSLGLNKTKGLLLALNSTFVPWLLISRLQGLFPKFLPVLACCTIYTYGCILTFCKDGAKIRKSVDLLAEGEWIVVALLVLLLASPLAASVLHNDLLGPAASVAAVLHNELLGPAASVAAVLHNELLGPAASFSSLWL
jgi:4-hydroxybenzoate polyprenyltransferase